MSDTLTDRKDLCPQKRTTLSKDVINEIHSRFPLTESKTGKSYKSTLDYTTMEIDFFENKAVKEVIAKYGLAPIGFYELIRVEIAKVNGYGICIENHDYKLFLQAVNVKLGLTKATLNKYTKVLIENKLLIIINGENGENTFYTTIQSIFNYEYRLYYRANNRKNTKAKRERKKKEAETTTTTAEPQTTATDYDFPNIDLTNDDLPF